MPGLSAVSPKRSPRECCERAVEAYRAGDARLQSVEAFDMQLVGWREFIRGVYWLEGPAYADRMTPRARVQITHDADLPRRKFGITTETRS